MASIAKFRDDISGAILTTGTSAAYIVASNQVFDTLADFHGQVIAFTPHVTNAAGPVTMTVDGFANLPVRTAPGVELLNGTIIRGTPYAAVYNNTDGALYLQGFYGNPYNVPLLGGMDYWDTVAPNSSFIFPAGQAISRTTYATAFARWGTKFGTGDGSTTFNVPDKTGRVSAMVESIAARLTAGGSGVDGGTFGAAGGVQDNSLYSTGQLPQFIPAGTISNGVITFPNGDVSTNTGGTVNGFTRGTIGLVTDLTSMLGPVQGTSTFTGAAIGSATPSPFGIVQPTIVCNYIIRII